MKSKASPKKRAVKKLSVTKPVKKSAPAKLVSRKAAAKKAAPKAAAPKKAAANIKPTAQTLVGSLLPAFTLPSTGGKTLSFNSLKGKAVVLYFYPKDATPGCTLEGHDFSRLKDQFQNVGAEVYGISRDTVNSHEKFKGKENYKLELLSDVDEKVCKIFDVIKMKNMYGKQVRGIERSTFVLDREGKVVKEWRGVKVPGHADEVLKFVESLT